MSKYIGDFAEDSYVRFMWNSNETGGASVDRATDGSIVIYKNDSTTEKTTANGVTDTEAFDTHTGVHQIEIDTSNDTGDVGFWAAGNDYFVVLDGAVIDGETVNACIGHFSIENRHMVGTDSAYTGTPPSASDIWTHGTRVLTAGTNLNDISVADVWAQAGADPSSVPTATADALAKLDFICAHFINEIRETASLFTLRDAANTGNIGTSGISDSAGTTTKNAMS